MTLSVLEISSIVIAALSLALFIFGLALTFLELVAIASSVLAVVGGLVGLFIALILWLLAPNLSSYFGVEKIDHGKRYHGGGASVPMLFEDERDPQNLKIQLDEKKRKINESEQYTINPDSTELLMRSIRGIPYLIQAIQYSLEATNMSEMGQSALNASVIHTAPGCTSVLDCDIEGPHCTSNQTKRNSRFSGASSSMPRFSGPEEQWQEQEKSLYWTNPQLRLSMLNRANVAMFPYSESQPIPTSESPQNEESSGNLMLDHGGSLQSNLSRVTVAHLTSSESPHEIRCIGMSSAFLSRFNNSFRT